MICLRCDNQTFVAKPDAVIEQEFKGELLKVQTPAMACSNCAWVTVDLDQLDELRRRTADAYRKKHGLLTSEEIKALRKLLQMSQPQFATFVGVGEASIKRWETWLVQEKSSDQLIRLKCEQPLRALLAQKSATSPVWISLEQTLIQGLHGITIQATQPKVVVPSRWQYRSEPPAPAREAEFQMNANYEAANSDLALAA